MTASDQASTVDQRRIGTERRVVEGILSRVNSPDGLDAFTTQVRGIRGCRRPVRLSGSAVLPP